VYTQYLWPISPIVRCNVSTDPVSADVPMWPMH